MATEKKTKTLYRVKGVDVDYDNKRYAEGQTIELESEPNERLARYLEPVDPQKEPKQ
ncbi:hypothetical protein [Metapseudomonas otitidis]|uniref:hypothetical protein n=1 Tax=Metapseudomonas otitidis TaxID=319939 RepID=UPI001F39D8B0|nr:hypothetical protein [Pseudomonas otitidis]